MVYEYHRKLRFKNCWSPFLLYTKIICTKMLFNVFWLGNILYKLGLICVFSLFSHLLINFFNTGVYGDVNRVKILYQKMSNALIQMADSTQAQLGKIYSVAWYSLDSIIFPALHHLMGCLLKIVSCFQTRKFKLFQTTLIFSTQKMTVLFVVYMFLI